MSERTEGSRRTPETIEQSFRVLCGSELLEKANALPLTPGVYIMRNAGGRVIYVGKSRKMKNRVSQYFQNSEKNIKTARMVSQVADFDYFLCDTEMEALTLENALIKQYTPKYNIRLKDAKSYPYVKITDEAWPRLVMTRKRSGDRGKYFGPYSGVSTAYGIIDALSRVLRLPTCRHSFPREIGRIRPCLYYQMGRCCGVCNGGMSREDYCALYDMAEDILGGRSGQVRRALEKQMLDAAETEKYEVAARCRDMMQALDKLGEKQKVVAAPDTEQDVFGLYTDEVCTCLSVFFIRAGVVSDKEDFLFGRDALTEEEDLSAFLCDFYAARESIPADILLSFPMSGEEREALCDYLSDRAGRRVYVRVPERGRLHTLCHLVTENARERAGRYQAESAKEEETLARLAGLVGLEVFPERIESYDISNLGTEHITAGMVVFENGQKQPKDYRTFRIRSVEGTTDDYASMREAISRRLAHEGEGDFPRLPDLILLDGGRGHVATVRALFAEKNVSIPVFGMVKDDFHKTRALCTDTEEISVAGEQAVYLLLYRIQEEVHRYTVSRMREAKRKTVRRSTLEKIKGIGAAKARLLLSAFGGLAGVKEADREALSRVRGISRAEASAVWQYFHEENCPEEETNI